MWAKYSEMLSGNVCGHALSLSLFSIIVCVWFVGPVSANVWEMLEKYVDIVCG